jgi:toxin secretion/phage lysis holin
MFKINTVVELSFLSGVIGGVLNAFVNLEVSGAILIILIAIDTLLGIKVAIKYKRFSSRGFLKFFKKVILYSIAIISVRLLEIEINTLYNINILSQAMIAFIAISETISILENLTILGVPIPSNFISIMLNNLNIVGLNKALESMRNSQKNILEIEEIIRYQLPNLKDENIKALLSIEFRTWKSIAEQINDFIDESDKNTELLYYKIMSLIEVGLKEIDYQLKEQRVCAECVEKFAKIHEPKVQRWLRKIEEICYSEKELQRKKEDLSDSIVIILYEAMLDAHKTVN